MMTDKNDGGFEGDVVLGRVSRVGKSDDVYRREVEALQKSVDRLTGRDEEAAQPQKNRAVYLGRTTRQYKVGSSLEPMPDRLTPRQLFDIYRIDPIVMSIVTTRCAQVSGLMDVADSKFDKGIRLVDLDEKDRKDFANDSEHERWVADRHALKTKIQEWVLTCGTSDKEVLDEAFMGVDKTFKYCTLRQWGVATAMNLLVFGRNATHVIHDSDARPSLFRPVPVETIYPVPDAIGQDRNDVAQSYGDDVTRETIEAIQQFNAEEPSQRPAAYIQKIDGESVAFFTEHDLQMGFLEKQTFQKTGQFPMAPIEKALFMVMTHMESLEYLRKTFVSGLMNKFIIFFESNNEAGVEVSEEDLDSFKSAIANMAASNNNSSSIPIMAGAVKPTVVPMSVTPKDMEFQELNNAVVRTLLACFQISSRDIPGLGDLGDGNRMSESSGDVEIKESEERGLRILVDCIFDQLNEIVYLKFPEAKGKIKVSCNGIGAETRQAVLQRHSQEMATTATMNDMLSDSHLNRTLDIGGDLPLNQGYHQLLQTYFTFGEIQEKLIGKEGASKRPEYDFYVNPAVNQNYLNLKAGGAQLQLDTNQAQDVQAKAQTQMTIAQAMAGQAQPGQQTPAEQVQKSEPMEKSFVEQWLQAHQD